MRIFNLALISLLAVALLGVGHTRYVPAKLKAMDVPLAQIDKRFGNMVAEVPCSIPYVFVNGTVADATQVNANFNAVVACLTTIYASDIIPTTAAQATFGWTIQYSFPAGVAVQGGSTNPLTNVANNLWLTQSGTSPGTYNINLSWSSCGSAGSIQLFNGTLQSFFDCSGNYNSGGGSIVGTGITSGNGNFNSPLATALNVCPAGCANSKFIFATSGLLTAPAQILAVASPAPANSPAPVSPCYIGATGLPCATTTHITAGNFPSLSISGSCTNGTLCTLTNNTVTFTGAAVFANAIQGCGVQVTATNLLGFLNYSGGTLTLGIYNLTGGAATGAQTAGYVCIGN